MTDPSARCPCGATDGVRRYQNGHACPAHTPARLAGRPEPGRTAGPHPAALRVVEPHAYGDATTDPLGRTGTGKNRLPVRLEGDATR